MEEDEIRDAFERNTAALERNTAAFERNGEIFESLKEFMHEITLRIESIGRQQVRVLSELVKEVRDLRAHSHAQREALFRIIDRLDGQGGAAPS